MQLLNGTSRGGSVIFEMAVSVALVVGVGVGVYTLQHPHLNQSQQITAAFQQ